MNEPEGSDNPVGGSGPGQGSSRRILGKTRSRVESVSQRSQAWVERQDPGSRTGVAIGAWRRYQAVDGPLQSALLSLYVLVAVLPALLVMEAYLDAHPGALANHLVHHYGLSGPTANLLRGVLIQDRKHELFAALLAIASALFFGLGFGRVLQLVHTRAWGLSLPKKQADQALYALVLVGFYGLILLLLVQLKELSGSPSWVGLTLAVGWVGLLVLFFVWAPRLLTHKLVSTRDLLPGAALTAVGLVVLMLISSFVMEFWVDLYARDYGGFGVVLAIYFWIAFSSAVIVAAASLSPALAERREFRGQTRIED
jgi:membrane protein